MHTVIRDDPEALGFAILFLLISVIGRVVSLVANGARTDAIRNVVPVGLVLAVSVVALVLFQRGRNDVAAMSG